MGLQKVYSRITFGLQKKTVGLDWGLQRKTVGIIIPYRRSVGHICASELGTSWRLFKIIEDFYQNHEEIRQSH